MRGLYAILDPAHAGERAPLALAEAVLRGGCAALQLRAKRLSDADFLALARPIQSACRSAGVPFFVNDRVDLAATLGADGLHLGQTDAPIAHARRRFSGLVGLSTHNLRQVVEAADQGADMIGFGPVFATETKQNPDPVVGLGGLQAACAQAPMPVIAIGGIGLDQVGGVTRAGARMVAVISALHRATDPEALARLMHAQAIAGLR